MKVTPEQLAAYADGELDEAAARAVEQEVARSADLQAQLAAHNRLKSRLSAHFAPIAEEPVPEHLAGLLQGQPAADNVIAFPARKPRFSAPSGWGRYVGPALAASLVLAMVGIGLRPSDHYAQGALATALDNQLAGNQSGAEPVRILISFRDRQGAFCRGYAEGAASGIACHSDKGWKLLKNFSGGAAETTEYRQAGSTAEKVFAAAQDMAVDGALDETGERAARERGWRR